ncbi:hypothetical protein H5968_21310 [Sphaerospermopsis sp. LEGE 00249]|uniref:hypothetical protein n=1 Tax=Sphaerospermopsis sp. LEGE 00249 TaxID=1380707 RepID=UPI00164E323E|nr:hypothetical protein [Sphaerospermopsis sp. LEGE 00249]MBC5797616.1 hypothetical protein [Sphaerospermopsis sp. LEGE 00249]
MTSSLKLTTYELWQNEDGSYDFFPSHNESARVLLDDNSQLIKKFEANSWEEARQQQYEFLGWGNYQPVSDLDDRYVSTTDLQGRNTTFIAHGFSVKEHRKSPQKRRRHNKASGRRKNTEGVRKREKLE